MSKKGDIVAGLWNGQERPYRPGASAYGNSTPTIPRMVTNADELEELWREGEAEAAAEAAEDWMASLAEARREVEERQMVQALEAYERERAERRFENLMSGIADSANPRLSKRRRARWKSLMFYNGPYKRHPG